MLNIINMTRSASALSKVRRQLRARYRILYFDSRLSITEAPTQFYGVGVPTTRYGRRAVTGGNSRSTSPQDTSSKLVLPNDGLTPSRQGTLDAFCGFYSLVNAMVYLHGPRVRRTQLFYYLLREYAVEWDVIELLEHGMETAEMDHLIHHVLLDGIFQDIYAVDVGKPFAKHKRLRIGAVIDRMQRFLAGQTEQQRRIVLIGTPIHWTLIYHIDDRYMHLFDSLGQNRAYRRSFTLRSGRGGHVLHRKSIYFLSSAQGGGL
ncbi:MAG: hypothetical protein VYE29_07870 [Pseudomonadota bacterium]|nr:hypothetical protein [Pseudomonadota bacterium]